MKSVEVTWTPKQQAIIYAVSYAVAISIVGLVNLSFERSFFYKFLSHSGLFAGVFCVSFLFRLTRTHFNRRLGKPSAF